MKAASRRLRQIALAMVIQSLPMAAIADGFFGQADFGNEASGGVLSLQRGSLTGNLNATRYEGGKELTASLLYSLPVEGFGLKLGPTFGWQWSDGEDREAHGGARLVIDRYSAASFGSTYFLADLASLNQSWFVLGQMNLDRPGLGLELSRGGSDSYHETTFALRKDLGDSPWALRAGYKFDSEAAFLGFSINTF